LGGHLPLDSPRIEPTPCFFESQFVDIGRDDLNLRRRPATFRFLGKQHRQTVSLLTRAAAGHPNSQSPRAVPVTLSDPVTDPRDRPLRLSKQLRDDLALERLEDPWV